MKKAGMKVALESRRPIDRTVVWPHPMRYESDADRLMTLGLDTDRSAEKRKSFELAVKSGLEKIGTKPLFFQKIALDYPLTESQVTTEYSYATHRQEYPHPSVPIDERTNLPSRGYARLGITIIHDGVARFWERRPISVFIDWDRNSLPDCAISILERLQVAGLPVGASVMVWTPERFSHIGGEVPDPMLVLEIGGNCYALCRWNG